MGKLIDERAVKPAPKKERPSKEKDIDFVELTKGVKTLEKYKEKIWSTMDVPEWLEDARWMVHPAVDTKKVLKIMKSTCWDTAKNRLVVVSSSGNMKYFGKSDAPLAFKDATVTPTIEQMPLLHTKDNDDTMSSDSNWSELQHKKRLYKKMLDKIIDQRQIDSISVHIDPWADEVKLHHREEERSMEIILNKLIQKAPKKVIDESIIEDYKEHFPLLETILKLVCAFRFGADTKQSYLWQRATSDWGKSFFWEGVLGGLGLAYLMDVKELKKAFSGDPVGLDPSYLTHSWLILFEEFSGAVKELKNITHTMVLTPKFGSRVKVDLYGKVFLSAENVNSLEDSKGVESQFANRFMKVMFEGSLMKRAKYLENKLKYFEVVQWYVYTKLQKEIETYLSLDRYGAASRAEAIQHEFRSNHKISSIDMMDTIHENLEPYYNKMRQKWLSVGDGSNSYKEDEEIRGMFAVEHGVLYVLQAGKVKEHFMNATFSRDEQKNLHHKSAHELLLLGKRTKKKFSEDIGYVNCYAVG